MGDCYEGSPKDVERAIKTHRARELSALKTALTRAHYLATGTLHEKLLPEGDVEQTLTSIRELTQTVQTVQTALDEETRKLAADGIHLKL